jgi:hypothetical protein
MSPLTAHALTFQGGNPQGAGKVTVATPPKVPPGGPRRDETESEYRDRDARWTIYQ